MRIDLEYGLLVNRDIKHPQFRPKNVINSRVSEFGYRMNDHNAKNMFISKRY